MLTGCTSESPMDHGAGSAKCTDGFLCDTDNTGIEHVDIDYEVSNSTVDSGSAADIRVGDNVLVSVPANGFTDESEFTVMHGFNETKLGYNRYGESNRTLFGNSPEMIFDIVEVSFDRSKLAGSIKITLNYYQEYLDIMNENLQIEYPGIPEFTTTDLGLFFFDKSEGEFILCDYDIDTSAHTFSLNTQIDGIYAVVLKPEAFKKMGNYFEAHPEYVEKAKALAAKSSAIELSGESYNYQTTRDPSGKSYISENPVFISRAEGEGLDYNKYAPDLPLKDASVENTNCGEGNGSWYGQILAAQFGDEPCYWHDWCYRYGKGTYNYSRKSCDNMILSDWKNEIQRRTKNPNSPRYFSFPFGVRVPNLAYFAHEIVLMVTRVVMYAEAYAAYEVIREMGEKNFKTDTSGCVDYLNKGVNCEIAKIRELKFEPSQLAYSTNESVSFGAKIFSNRPEEYVVSSDNAKPDSIEWNVSPYSSGFSLMSSTSNPNTSWLIPPDAVSGIYTVTASLYDSGRVIHTKEIKLNVGSTDAAILAGGYNFGGTYPDYARSAKMDSDGNLYASVSYGASERVVTGTHRECHTEWCGNPFDLFRCEKCKTVTDYADVARRTDYIVKFNSSMEQVWARDFPGQVVNDVAYTADGGVNAIIDGKTLVALDSDGSTVSSSDITIDTWTAEKIMTDSTGSLYLFYAQPAGGIIARKYSSSGSLLAEAAVLSGTTVTSCILKDNSIYILGGGTGFISAVKLDLNLVEQWVYDKIFTGAVTPGSMTADSTGALYFTGEAQAGEIFGSGAAGKACFIAKVDPLGNEVWIKGINGADYLAVPQVNQYYLASRRLPPLIDVSADGTVRVISGTTESKTVQVWVERETLCTSTDDNGVTYSYKCGTEMYQVDQTITVGSMVIRTYNSSGGVESIRTVPSYNGTHYYQGMFVDHDGRINIYGSTTGRMIESSVNSGMLDWFYVRVEN